MKESEDMKKIEEYLNSLTFEKTFMGVSQNDVYECLKTLSGMYEAVIQNIENDKKNEIQKLEDLLAIKNSRIEQLQRNSSAAEALESQNQDEIRSLEQEKKEYAEKTELLVKSIVEVQKEKEERRKQAEQECSRLISQAKKESEKIKKEAQNQAHEEYKKTIEAMQNLDQARKNLKSGLQVIISELSEIMSDETKWQPRIEEIILDKDEDSE